MNRLEVRTAGYEKMMQGCTGASQMQLDKYNNHDDNLNWWENFFSYLDKWYIKDIETMLARSHTNKNDSGGLNYSIFILLLIGMELLGFISSNGYFQSEEYKESQKEKLESCLKKKKINMKMKEFGNILNSDCLSVRDNPSEKTFNKFWVKLTRRYTSYKKSIGEIFWQNRNTAAHNFFFNSKIKVSNDNSKEHLKTKNVFLIISNKDLFEHWKVIYLNIKKQVMRDVREFECAKDFLQNKLS
ncbi:hypothetical protein JW766_01620 [Candidatus Dojkabacteria bacterium]|nr:hypothetical protein [Candidatus Dojkabacteria bacterium]